MTVYEGSRYENSSVFYDEVNDKIFLGVPKEIFEKEINDITIPFTEGMRLDLLANQYYNDSQLDWVILQANPQYATSEDIQVGDLITIPAPWRVMENV